MPTTSGYVDTIKRNNAYYDIHDTGLRNTIGQANGLATLDDNGKLPTTQLPSDTTTSASGNPISISNLKSNQLAINPIITFEPIQAGSGTPSPSNVRAISGYDKIEVLSCGKNLYADSDVVYTGQISKQLSIRLKAGTYKLSAIVTSADTDSSSCLLYDTENNISLGTIARSVGSTRVSMTLNLTKDTSNITFYASTSYQYSQGDAFSFKDIQIEEGSSATTYEPSVKTTDLSESLGQTVYKGSLDVRTGLLTVTHKILDLGDYEWSYHASTSATDTNRFAMTTVIPDILNNGGDVTIMPYIAACSCYALSTGDDNISGGSSRSGYISQYGSIFVITDTRYNDSTAFKTAVTGQKVVYQLAIPFTIQLTPHEISLLKDYAYVSTNGTSIALDYHNGEMASLADVSQLGETVNELGGRVLHSKRITKVLGNVTANTRYEYFITDDYPYINENTLKGISLIPVTGNSALDYTANLFWTFYQGKVSVIYYCNVTQSNAYLQILVLY